MWGRRGNPFIKALAALFLFVLFTDAFVLMHGASADTLWGHYHVNVQPVPPTATTTATASATGTATNTATQTATPTATATCAASLAEGCPNCTAPACSAACSPLVGECGTDSTCNCSIPP